MFLLYAGFLYSSMTIQYDSTAPSLIIEEEVIENQICQGFFKPVNTFNCKYEASIVSADRKLYYFLKDNLSLTEETHFSFNTRDPQTLIIEIKPLVIDSSAGHKHGSIEYSFDSQFDTFNKDVAKGVRVEPAVFALTNLEKLLYEVYLQTEMRAEKLNRVSRQQDKIVRFVVLFSILSLGFVVGVNVYHIISMKRFFKKKKLI